MWPYTSGQYISLDAHHNIYIHCAHAEGDVPDKTGHDATEQNAAVPEAPAHVVARKGAGHLQSSSIDGRVRAVKFHSSQFHCESVNFTV